MSALAQRTGPPIVALQMKRIGDLLLTTPALAALRARHPDSRIILGGGPISAVLAPALPMVDEVIAWRPGMAGALDAARIFGKGSDGMTLDFTGTDRTALATMLSKAPVRRSFSWMERKGNRARCYTELIESSVRDRHTVDHYLDLVGGPTDSGVLPPHGVLDLPETALQAAADLLTEHGVDVAQPYIVVHPGSAREEKHWLPGRWAILLHRMLEQFDETTILLTGTKDAHEAAHLEAILENGPDLPRHRLINLAGRTPLLTLAAIIESAWFLVGVDSAAVHFAGAFGVPSLSLYGPTNPYHWRVRAENAWVVQAGHDEVTPDEAFTPRHVARGMNELDVETTWAGVEKILDL